jgi:hypothetical protein
LFAAAKKKRQSIFDDSDSEEEVEWSKRGDGEEEKLVEAGLGNQLQFNHMI